MLKNISLFAICQACEETHNALPENITKIYTYKLIFAPVSDVIRSNILAARFGAGVFVSDSVCDYGLRYGSEPTCYVMRRFEDIVGGADVELSCLPA